MSTLVDLITEAVRRGANDALSNVVVVPEVEAAIAHLIESIYPNPTSGVGASGPAGRHTKSDNITEKGQVYNAHTSAAHRSSVSAYSSGDHASHTVASMHHKHAAEAATDAASAHPAGSPSRKDYESAAAYHNAQSKAHDMAAATAKRGNNAGSSGYWS